MDSPNLRESTAEPVKLPRRERENLRQRREILDTALRLFSENGFHQVSMQQIAKTAEFGVGTIYKFFSNKQHLYKTLIMETADKWQRAVLRELDDEPKPDLAIRKYFAAQRELFFQNLSVVRLYYSETKGACFNMKAGFDEDLVRLRDERIGKLASVFDAGVKQGVFRDLDPYHMALALHGILDAFLLRMSEDPSKFRDRDELSNAAEIFLGGIVNK